MAMPYRFKEARLQLGKTLTEVSEEMKVSKATISNWESGRKLPSIETLEKLADYYGITTDYLLGRSSYGELLDNPLKPIEHSMLPVLHGFPVWCGDKCGLVDAINEVVVFLDQSQIPFSDTHSIMMFPSPFSTICPPVSSPILKSELEQYQQVWLEPISKDEELRRELRGWYRVNKRYVENEFGIRFYLDTYNAKWLAFHKK